MSDWAGTNPYFLMIREGGSESYTQIDLDERGWLETHQRLMRTPGTWFLCRKPEGSIVAMMRVYEGEQPYYVARHVGSASVVGDGTPFETINYGIGKKRLDGHVDRIWIMANGCVTLGDDVEDISLELLKAGHV